MSLRGASPGTTIAGGLALCLALLAAPGLSAPAPPVSPFPGGSYFASSAASAIATTTTRSSSRASPAARTTTRTSATRRCTRSTTPATLRGGATTCELAADASTYWIPTLFVGAEPMPRWPGSSTTSSTRPARRAVPDGLKMVTGNAEAKTAPAEDRRRLELRRHRRQAPRRRAAAVRGRPGAAAPRPLPELLERQDARQPRPQAAHGVRGQRRLPASHPVPCRRSR